MRFSCCPAFGLALFLSSWSSPARADERPCKTASFELQANVGLGGPIGLAFGPNYSGITTIPFTEKVGARIRFPKYSTLAIEPYMLMENGFGVAALFDAVRTDRFRLHIIDFGIFWNSVQPVSVRRVDRAYDITVGLGMEYGKGPWLFTVDWRAFLPDPYGILTAYGAFARAYYAEALKGGQLWLGFSFSWPP